MDKRKVGKSKTSWRWNDDIYEIRGKAFHVNSYQQKKIHSDNSECSIKSFASLPLICLL